MPGPATQPPFAAHAVQLSAWQWLIVSAVVLVVTTAVPAVWSRMEPLPETTNTRVPFRLGDDYWIFERYARQPSEGDQTIVLGDSVIWGHYVSKDETLSAHLNQLSGGDNFYNLGIDGIHPAALAGLVDCYGQAIARRRVVIHCNPLWMSSPQHDLTSEKEFAFNHPSLVPQFFPRIRCYREPLSDRLGNVVGRNVTFMSWARHLQIAYLGGTDWATWTLEHPRENPLRNVTRVLPSPDEPPSPAPTAEPWMKQGIKPANLRWVDFTASLQWESFRRAVELLRNRKNRVFVVVGPFNEHMLLPASAAAYQSGKQVVAQWLSEQGIPHRMATVLPSDTYADASHPLDSGYQLWAEQLWADEAFRQFLR
jgi:hypothetical protein